jgi:peptide/nickel transport system permease protein
VTTFLLRRLAGTLVVLWLVTVLVFVVIGLVPGDPTLDILGPEAPPEAQQALRAQLGLDRPLPVQYLDWLGRALRGDLGRSFFTREPVLDAVLPRLAPTIQLSLFGLIFALAIALPLGTIAALRPRSPVDFAASLLAVGGIAVPSFWLAILLIWLFSLTLRWLPPAGYVNLFHDPLENLKLMLLPALTLGAAMAAVVTRMLRSSLLEVLDQDYIQVARAKGLAEELVVARHALKNALVPVVTLIGLQMSRLIGGAVIVETIFSLPGLGRLVVDAILNRDFPRLQGAVLVIVVGVVLVNFAVDLAYARLDPRVRYE